MPAKRATAAKKTVKTSARGIAKRSTRKSISKSTTTSTRKAAGKVPRTKAIPLAAPGSPSRFRARIRMYRHGLGDCFLITFARPPKPAYNILIDCGVLNVGAAPMQEMVRHIRDTIRQGTGGGKARLDLVVATHEHKDHLSGFNQARALFNDDFDIGAVWMGWTENLSNAEVKKIKDAKRKAGVMLAEALKGQRFTSALSPVGLDVQRGLQGLLAFNDDVASGRIADALEYLKVRGEDAGDLQFLEPGDGPLPLHGVPDVRVYVLGPPTDPLLLKASEVTQQTLRDGLIYHLARTGDAGVASLAAAARGGRTLDDDRFNPFAAEHRIPRTRTVDGTTTTQSSNPWFARIKPFVDSTYDAPALQWRRIDDDWLAAYGQLALDLDNDTNNTSLVLAFEFAGSGDVLLFVGDAQVGNWKSWADISFAVPGRATPLPAHDLLARTIFYKVGHHCSHNGTLKAGGLELMNRKNLVAFIPLDEAVARNQGTSGWDMPAAALLDALNLRTAGRTVQSDRSRKIPEAATDAGVRATELYVDYFVK